LEQRFGVGHVVDVLSGAKTERIECLGHHMLSTYGLISDQPKSVLMNMVFQLLDQGLLSRTEGEYPVLRLNPASIEVLRGERKVLLMPVKTRKVKKTVVEKRAWAGVDQTLFEALRDLRTELARERGVPPYVIFGDRTLREMAQLRPEDDQGLLMVHGVGEKKLQNFGEAFLAVIREHAKT
jgi:ATP-dependent DNA helicase RecQ